MADPRYEQIAILSALLGYGVLSLDFGISPAQGALTLGAAIATEWLGCRIRPVGRPGRRFHVASPLITGLSLCLLLRVDDPVLAAIAATLAIASKFVLRIDGRHVVNPSALGLALVLAFSDRAWISSGQWGSVVLAAALVVCAGSHIVRRARRSDVTWTFAAATVGLVAARALWLGDPFEVAFHGLSSGALLLFTFFMISDPRTTPASRAGRVTFALTVAALAHALRFGFYEPNAPIWALVACSPLLPLLDRWLPATERGAQTDGGFHAIPTHAQLPHSHAHALRS